jgi:HAD superfamily hydrolase (TIGR01549 family)
VSYAGAESGGLGARATRNGAVIFDVDGTLLDTNYLHVLAWSRAFRDHGRQVPMSVIHSLIGMGSDKLLDRLVGGGVPDPSELDESHSRHYRELQPEMRAFEGAAGLLRTIAGRGAAVILGTSAKADELEAMRIVLDAGDTISQVVSSGDAENTKPDPDIFAIALERCGLPTGSVVVVGDTVWDIEAAHRLGLGCVAVETGGIPGRVLSDAGALCVYHDVATLLRELDSSPLRPLLAD